MSFKNVLCLPALLWLISCQPAPKENKVVEALMYGEWQNVSLRLSMNSYNNTTEKKDFIVNENEWEKKMNMRPIRTFFRNNGSYISAHYNLEDKLIYCPAGSWAVFGDTIIMRDTFPEQGMAYKYKIKMNRDVVELTGIEDCDHDGHADDNYYGVLKRTR